MSAGAKAIFEEANDSLGFDLARLAFEGPEAELALTANTQPAVLTASVCRRDGVRRAGLGTSSWRPAQPRRVHSALGRRGAIRFSDAVRHRAQARRDSCKKRVPVGTGAMAAIMGIELAAVEEGVHADAAQGEVVEIANVNSALQIVIAGHRSARRARRRARHRAGREDERHAPGERALPLLAHGAGRRPARARARRAA